MNMPADYRTWEPQMRRFSRQYRCVTYSQRGYPPSDIPNDPAKYSQDLFRDDVIAVMDALKIDKAHVVGHSMGAVTALHVGIRYPQRCISVTAAGCGYGSSPDPKVVEAIARGVARNRQDVRHRKHGGRRHPLRRRAHAPGAEEQGPARLRPFVKMLSEHSSLGHSLTMLNLQAKRPTLWEMEADLKKFSPPLLVIVGDEDDWCLDASIYLRRTAPTAGLLVIPRSGHTITSEEPAAFNAAVAELIAAAEAGRWLAHKPNR